MNAVGAAALLGPGDPLPRRPERVLVAGTSGAGKTTLARALAEVLDCSFVELDSLHHGSGWTKRAEFEDDVHRVVAGAAWASEWQYGAVRDVLLARADLLVWLDLPRRLVMARLLRRTLRRRLRREVLWNGNVEPPLWTFLTERDHIVRWAWRTHVRTADRVTAAGAARPGLVVVRLTTPAQVSAWVDGPLRSSLR